MTIREQILKAMLGALNTGAPSGVPVVQRLRATNIEPADLPDGVLVPGPEAAKRVHERTGALVERSLTVFLTWRAAGDATKGPDEATDPLFAWGTKALAGNRLGGLVISVEETGVPRWDFSSKDRFYVSVPQQFEVTYTTRIGDAEQRN